MEYGSEHVAHNAGVGSSSLPPATTETPVLTSGYTSGGDGPAEAHAASGTPSGTTRRGDRSRADERNGRLVARIRAMLDYDAESGILTWKRSGETRYPGTRAGGTDAHNGYRVIRIDGRLYPEHRVVWMHAHGEIPQGLMVDHINRKRDDNRMENLRVVTRSVNTCNSEKVDNARGVYLRGDGRWDVQIRVDGVRLRKEFRTEAEAREWHQQQAQRRGTTRREVAA